MPYIEPRLRELINKELEELINKVKTEGLAEPEERDGIINYITCMLIKKVYGKNLNYKDYNAIIGVLECIKQEIYRRLVAPYEDEKIKENTDVF